MFAFKAYRLHMSKKLLIFYIDGTTAFDTLDNHQLKNVVNSKFQQIFKLTAKYDFINEAR